MTHLLKATLTVAVSAFDNTFAEGATVTLIPVADTEKKVNRPIQMEYNTLKKVFAIAGITPGRYVVEAGAKGFEPQQREVNLNSGEHEENFVLGRKGMPFYYRGNVMVPFEKHPRLLALTLAGKDFRSQESKVTETVQRLGLERIETSSDVLENGVLVFHLTGGKEFSQEEETDEIIRQLENTYGVAKAGPVISFRHNSVSYLTRQIIVKFRSDIEKNRIPGIAREYGCRVMRPITYIGNGWLFESLRPASFDILDICSKLVISHLVEYAEPNMAFTVVNDFTPNDFLYHQQGHHAVIQSEGAWDVTRGDSSIIISIVDGGFDVTHPDFQNVPGAGWNKVYSPFDFVYMDSDPRGSDHGVESSGIAAANGNNAEGISGMAQNCVLLPVRYPSGSDDLNFSDMYIWIAGFNPGSTTAGFPASINPGADVIGNSFGFYQPAISGIMKDTFDYLTTYGRNGKGCVIVFSVGNDNLDFNNGNAGNGRKWASYPRTIAVAASTISPPDPAEIKSTTSNFGMNLDVCAPGGNTGSQTRSISSYNVGSGSLAGSAGSMALNYGSFGQTSCASPQVSGVAALMLSANPNLSWIEVRQLLRSTAQKIDFANTDTTGMWVDLDGDGIKEYSQWYGYGRINAAAAVAGARDFAANSDILVRDNLSDPGTVPSAGTYWHSPDVWVRTTDPVTDGIAALPADYTSEPPHQTADRTHDNWVYVRMKNTGTAASGNFYVRLYIAHWPGTEFIFPNDFIPTNNPGEPISTPMARGTYLIGETLINSLGAGSESVVNFRWEQAKIPPDTVMAGGTPAQWHPCLLVQIAPQDGPMPSGNHIWDSGNLIQRNITIVGVDDDDTTDFAVAMVIGNEQNSNRIAEVEIDRGKLPDGIRLYLQATDPKVMDQIEKQQKKRSAKPMHNRCELQVLNDTKAIIRYRDNESTPVSVNMMLTKNSTLDLCNCKNDNPTGGSFTAGTYKGKRVVFLDHSEKVRVPIVRAFNKLTPIIIGGIIQSKPAKGTYDVSVNQYDHNDVLSGSYGIQLKF